MSHEKKHRHDMSQEPQSTDVADLEQDGAAGAQASHAAHAASHKQRQELVEGDGERYSGPVGRDVEARILSVEIRGGQTRILLSKGRQQGVEMTMEGYIKNGSGGMLADFYVDSVSDRTAWAVTDVTLDQIGEHVQVVVNPSSKPASAEPQKDMKARLLGLSIENGKTKITIGRGRRSGAAAGMQGYVVGHDGKPAAHFVIAEEHSALSSAYVDLTIDELKDLSEVILNPS